MTMKTLLAGLAATASLSAAGCDWLKQSPEQQQQAPLPLAIAQARCTDLSFVSAAIEVTRLAWKGKYRHTSTGEEITLGMV